MSAATIVQEALAAEQERLSKLPYARVSAEALADFYGGKIVLKVCPGSGQNPREPRTEYSDAECPGCYIKAEPITKDGILIEHAKPLTDREQDEEALGAITALLGFDEWSDAGLYTRASTRDEGVRRMGSDGRIAHGLGYLVGALHRREASTGARAAVESLLTFTRDGDEAPMFTEVGLYDLIGKDAARSVLSRTRDLATAIGGVDRES